MKKGEIIEDVYCTMEKYSYHRCMVVQSDVGERRLVMVVLDSPNNAQRADDMRTMRAYVQSESDFSRDFEHVAPYEIF